MKLLRELLTKHTWSIPIILFIVWRVSICILATTSDIFIAYQPSFPYAQRLVTDYNLPKRIYSMANFDGVHYLTIIEKGYVGTGLIQAFFPAYPLSAKLLNLLFNNALLSSFILSNTYFLAALLVWWDLIKTKWSQKVATACILILITFPTSFFFGAIYSESLFLLLVGLCWWASERKKWWLAGFAALLASATKVVGIWLVPTLLIEILVMSQSGLRFSISSVQTALQKNSKAISFVSLGSLGLIFYMLFLYFEFNDPLYFFHVQSEFGAGRQETLVLWPQVVWRYLKILTTIPLATIVGSTTIQEAVAGIFGLGALVLLYKKIPLSWISFSLLAFITPTLTGTFSSMPRYILSTPAVWLFIGLTLANRPRYLLIWLTLSTALLVWNTILFVQGYWVA